MEKSSRWHPESLRQRRQVLVVIPAYNEELCIRRVLQDLEIFGGLIDVLVVDDGSVDQTSREVLSTGAELLRLPCNLGIGGALQAALKYAEKMGYEYTLRLDADGQHDPEDALRLLSSVMIGEADVAIGSRFLATQWLGKNRNYHTTATRSLGIKFFSQLISNLIGQPITDPTSGLRCYNRRVIRYLARHHPQDYPEIESLVVLHRAGFRLVELPATIHPRMAGKSSIDGWKSVYYIFRVLLAAVVAALSNLPKAASEEAAHVT